MSPSLQNRESPCPPSHPSSYPIIVVGGGLAGLSAAIEAEKAGAKVVLFEKERSVGGNSAKATSGINGCETKTQQALGVEDSKDKFSEDTLKSGEHLSLPDLVRPLLLPLSPPQVEVFVEESSSAIDFLSSFGLSLSVLTQLGGHSVARTHRLPARCGTLPRPAKQCSPKDPPVCLAHNQQLSSPQLVPPLTSSPSPDGKPVGVGFSIMNALKKYALASPNIALVHESQVDELLVRPP